MVAEGSAKLGGLTLQLPVVLVVAAQLSACDLLPKQPDPRMAVLNSRAHSIIDMINGPEDLRPKAYKDVSNIMCPGISKMWMPTAAGDVGDVEFISVPGQTVPPPLNASDFPPQPPERIPTYQFALASKSVGLLTPVAIMMIFNPDTGDCGADIWTSGP
jgi:hypothetical protein